MDWILPEVDSLQAAYASYLTSPCTTSGSIAIPPPSLATSSAALSGLAAAICSGEMAASAASPKNPLFPIAFKNDDRVNDGAAAAATADDDDDDDDGRISPGVESPSQMLNGGGDGGNGGHKNNNVESRLLLQGSIDSLRLRAKEMSAEAVDVKASAAAGDA